MNISFEGKRILVTGAGQGIGREICTELAKTSSTVKIFALAKTPENLQSLKAEYPSNIETVCVDLADWDATRKAVEEILPIDGVVNSAGVGMSESVLETKPETFDKVFNINVKAVINVCQVVAQDLKNRKAPGSIVNISSQASQAALKDHLVYCGSKGALDMITKVMALELGPYNIRFNCINPTVVLTAMGRKFWSDPERAAPMLSKIPLGRFAEVDDITGAVLFLLSDRSAMVNGTCLPIDGGFLAT